MAEMTEQFRSGTPCWVDLTTDDLAASKAFYHGLFGWTYRGLGEQAGDYTFCLHDDKHVAALVPMPPSAPPTPVAWTTYLATDDADEVAKATEKRGGHVLAGPMDVTGQGRMTIASDPTGAVFGAWQAGGFRGFAAANEPNTVCWNDLTTYEPRLAADFYTAVFDLGTGETEQAETADDTDDEPDYTTFTAGGRPVAGVYDVDPDLPAGTEPHWLTYFAVVDTEAAVAKITATGGTVLRGPLGSPYGDLAVVRDPRGATFAVITLAGDP